MTFYSKYLHTIHSLAKSVKRMCSMMVFFTNAKDVATIYVIFIDNVQHLLEIYAIHVPVMTLILVETLV